MTTGGGFDRSHDDLALAFGAPGEDIDPKLNHRVLRFNVVSSLDDFMRVQTVRSLTFMAEQDCPYDEEFDGNDFTGIHILARYDREPVGTLRLRFFSDFAKLERVAVRRQFRRSAFAGTMIRYALAVCARKGYSLVYAHAQVRLLDFWKTVGFVEMPGRDRFVFSDHEYAHVSRSLPADPKAVTLDSDPLTIIRPEGQWDQPGVLDLSVTRGATNPVNEDD